MWDKWVATSGHEIVHGPSIPDEWAEKDRLDIRNHPKYISVIDEPDTILALTNVGDVGDPFILVLLYRRVT